ncbi:MAG: hypothetical protein KIT84_29285 [Labilithrix sp.]|nr:hypothetical protein [Labilithrix sp.]MCW5815156.1 hypothetical protein [Labilithrix sp.]
MRPLLLPFALSAALLLTACDSCEKKPDATKDTPDAAVAIVVVDAAPAPIAVADAAAPRHPMSNCPTAVTGAEVAIKDVPGGVELEVTAKDEATTREIRERVKKLADANDQAGGAKHHNGTGAGGGTTGRCTIINRNTKLSTAEIPNGAKVTVLAKDKAEIDWLRRETRDRDVEAKSTIAEGAGALRMLHCPSAVDGAKTTVKDVKDGVVVTITGTTEQADEIRKRAKHTADVAKKTMPSTLQHSGEGTGGGGVGRCPIVVEGETVVELKDVPNGVEATVTAKKGVAELQRETKERAANFGAK